MRELVNVTGIVIKSDNYAEYDRRITLLTDDRGKITVFVHGARRSGNRFMAKTEPFAFGEFVLTEGRSAYNMQQADISCYFEELRANLKGYYLGSYILELADYYSRENNDDLELLKLVYQTLKAIVSEKFSLRLIQAVYQIKAIVVNGEFPGVPIGRSLMPGTVHAVEHVMSAPIEKLYTFELKDKVLDEFARLSDEFRQRLIHKKFNSLAMVEAM